MALPDSTTATSTLLELPLLSSTSSSTSTSSLLLAAPLSPDQQASGAAGPLRTMASATTILGTRVPSDCGEERKEFEFLTTIGDHGLILAGDHLHHRQDEGNVYISANTDGDMFPEFLLGGAAMMGSTIVDNHHQLAEVPEHHDHHHHHQLGHCGDGDGVHLVNNDVQFAVGKRLRDILTGGASSSSPTHVEAVSIGPAEVSSTTGRSHEGGLVASPGPSTVLQVHPLGDAAGDPVVPVLHHQGLASLVPVSQQFSLPVLQAPSSSGISLDCNGAAASGEDGGQHPAVFTLSLTDGSLVQLRFDQGPEDCDQAGGEDDVHKLGVMTVIPVVGDVPFAGSASDLLAAEFMCNTTTTTTTNSSDANKDDLRNNGNNNDDHDGDHVDDDVSPQQPPVPVQTAELQDSPLNFSNHDDPLKAALGLRPDDIGVQHQVVVDDDHNWSASLASSGSTRRKDFDQIFRSLIECDVAENDDVQNVIADCSNGELVGHLLMGGLVGNLISQDAQDPAEHAISSSSSSSAPLSTRRSKRKSIDLDDDVKGHPATKKRPSRAKVAKASPSGPSGSISERPSAGASGRRRSSRTRKANNKSTLAEADKENPSGEDEDDDDDDDDEDDDEDESNFTGLDEEELRRIFATEENVTIESLKARFRNLPEGSTDLGPLLVAAKVDMTVDDIMAPTLRSLKAIMEKKGLSGWQQVLCLKVRRRKKNTAAVRSSRKKRSQYVVGLRREIEDLKNLVQEAQGENCLLRQLADLWGRLCSEVEVEVQEGVSRQLNLDMGPVTRRAAARIPRQSPARSVKHVLQRISYPAAATVLDPGTDQVDDHGVHGHDQEDQACGGDDLAGYTTPQPVFLSNDHLVGCCSTTTTSGFGPGSCASGRTLPPLIGFHTISIEPDRHLRWSHHREDGGHL